MQIIIGILSILAFIVVWYWRIKALSEAAKDGAKLAKSAANLPRKLAFRNRSGKRGLGVVNDPREAATIMMLEVAQARGPLTELQQACIRAEIMQHFEFTESDADKLISQSAWLSRDEGAPDTIVRRMAGYLQSTPSLGPEQLIDMDGMLVAVSEAEGTPTTAQLDLISTYRRKTGLQV
ncbi:MAG: hypothetical protein AAGA24_01850 [Pseudomonadota bacterium]